jgi:hypothetical protein
MDFKHNLEEYTRIINTKEKNKKELKLCEKYIKPLEKILLMTYKKEGIILSDPNLIKLMEKIEKKYLPK